MTKDIEKDIIAITADILGVDEEEITTETNFYEDLGINSIKAIEITVALEKKFKISIRDEDVPNVTTVNQATDMINKLLSQKSLSV